MHRALHRWVREIESISDFARTNVVACSEASSYELGCYIHSFPQRLGRRTHLLPPFAMRAAFPRSDYYGGSAPRPRHRQTCRFAGLRVPGARIGVPMFTGETRGAVGGRLHPWQHGPRAESGYGGGVPISGTPSHAENSDQALAAYSQLRVLAPYRGFHHRLQLRVAPPRFTVAPSVARLGAVAPSRAVQTARLLQAAGTVPGDVRGPLLHPVRPGRG